MSLEVNLDSIDLLERSNESQSGSSQISIADRQDAETILKTKQSAAENPSFQWKPYSSTRSLSGSATLGAVNRKEEMQQNEEVEVVLPEPITRDHPAMNPEHLHAIDQELARIQTLPLDGSSEEGNFLIKMRAVVAKILIQFNQISDKDRVQMDKMKRDYSESTQKAADLQRTLGSSGLYIAAVGFGVMLAQFGFSNPADREVMKFLAEQIPHGGGMFTGRYQANQKEADSLAQLLLAEYNAKTSKTQSESGSKQEIINLLDKVLESMKRASMAN